MEGGGGGWVVTGNNKKQRRGTRKIFLKKGKKEEGKGGKVPTNKEEYLAIQVNAKKKAHIINCRNSNMVLKQDEAFAQHLWESNLQVRCLWDITL